MSNFNKVVTNIPVSLTETEMSNLSQTFSGIIQGGGGGGEGKRYNGDGVYVTVNNDANPGVISLTQTSLDKLNKEIPSAVSSFPDSVQYAKKTYVDSTFQTKDDMSAYAKKTDIPDSITDFADTDTVIYSYLYPLTGDIQQQINGKQNKLQFDLNAKGEISAIGPLNGTTALAGAGGVTGDYYSASNPSGFVNSTQVETQILEKHYLTEASGNSLYVPIPEGLSDNQYYAYTTSSWKVIQGAGDVSGIATVAHDDTLTGNGNNENLGVDITKIQTKLTDAQIQNITDVTTLKTASSTWNNVSAKLNTSDFNTYTATTAPSTYQQKGNYLSANALTNYYTKSETSGATQLSTEFGKYITTAQYNTDSATFALKTDLNDLVSSASVTTNDNYVMTTTGWKVLTLPGGGMTQVIHDETLTGQGNANDNKLGVAWSALSGNTIASANSAYFATKAKYGDQREYEIGSEIYGLTYFRTSIINWTNLITGNSGIDVLDLDDDGYPEIFQLTQTAYNAVTSVSSKLDTTAAAQTYLTTATYSVDSATFLTKSSADNDYAPISISATVNTLTAASAGWNDKVDKPTSLNDKYLVLRTDNAGNVSGWCDFQDQSYSKSEALGTFVATANIDTTTLSGDGKSVSTKLGVKTDVIATRDYVSGNYLPTSGGTVSGQLVVSGGSNFDTQFLKIIRENVNGHARLGLGQYGALALKADDSNSHTTQINVSPNTTNDQLVQVQHNGNTVGYLIPAVTATSTDGLTNDGILHIILES